MLAHSFPTRRSSDLGRFAGSTALGSVGSTSIFVTLFTPMFGRETPVELELDQVEPMDR